MNTKLRLIAASLIFLVKNAASQFDSLDYYISRLNWNSFAESPMKAPKLTIGEDILKLIKYENPQKITSLIENLKDPNKTVACHIALTKVFDSTYNRFGCNGDSGGPSTLNYVYNGLRWSRTQINNDPPTEQIIQAEVDSIIKYWKQRLASEKERVNHGYIRLQYSGEVSRPFPSITLYLPGYSDTVPMGPDFLKFPISEKEFEAIRKLTESRTNIPADTLLRSAYEFKFAINEETMFFYTPNYSRIRQIFLSIPEQINDKENRKIIQEQLEYTLRVLRYVFESK